MYKQVLKVGMNTKPASAAGAMLVPKGWKAN